MMRKRHRIICLISVFLMLAGCSAVSREHAVDLETDKDSTDGITATESKDIGLEIF